MNENNTQKNENLEPEVAEESAPEVKSEEKNEAAATPAPKKSVMPIIIGAMAAVIVALVVVLVILLGGKDKPSSNNDNPTSDNQGQNDSNPCKDGHLYSEWVETVAPACTKVGEERRYCKYCNHFEARDVVEIGHNYVGEECTHCGYPVPSEGLEFTSNGDGTCYVSGKGSCTDTYVVIPSMSPDGDRVTSIGEEAFVFCLNLTSVMIPNSVTSIDDYSFALCAGLTSIIIPDSVTSIGNSAFSGCLNLTSITIPDGVTSIGLSAFSGCSSLTSITVNENNSNYKSIDGSLYTKDEKNLIKYAIGKNNANFVIPDSVTSIGAGAFAGCTSLTSITIPDSVNRIGDSVFYGCTSLTSITVDANNANYKSIDGDLYTKDGTILIQYVIGKTDTNFVIPDGVKYIDNSAFNSCTSLTSITIPDSVTSIGERAFYSCTSLMSVTIGDGVISIGEDAFYSCTSLTSVTIGNSVTSIEKEAFSGCGSLTNVYYKGSEADWAKIFINYGNSIISANITFNYQN